MTALFERHGLKIQYPENWEVQHRVASDKAVEVSLIAPTGAYWSLLAFPKATDADQLMLDSIDSLKEQYESVEYAPVVEMIGAIRTKGYDMHFFCLDLLITARLRSLDSETHNLMLMYQAENREFDEMNLVFQAITISMLQTGEVPAESVDKLRFDFEE